MLKLMNSNLHSCNVSTEPEIWDGSCSRFPRTGINRCVFLSNMVEIDELHPSAIGLPVLMHQVFVISFSLRQLLLLHSGFEGPKFKVPKSLCEVFFLSCVAIFLQIPAVSSSHLTFESLRLKCPAGTPWAFFLFFLQPLIFHEICGDGR